MMLLRRSALVVSCFLLIAQAAWVGGCEANNTNEVDCQETDCQASCIELGHTGGQCVDEETCKCEPFGQDSYPWKNLDDDTETPGDAGMDAGGDASVDASY